MRVSVKWLNDYVAIDVPVDKLVEQLDLSGTKVEAVHRPARDIDGVVVGEVLNVSKHPNADTLSLVEVTTGAGEAARVVCGASNFSAGDRVPFARVGAQLPELTITQRKIRGETSAGMLCSAAELGVSRDHSGILVLPPDSPLGEDVVPILGLDDTILELEITPNRPDCMSMTGVAREVAALLGNELKMPDAVAPSAQAGSPVEVDIQDAEGCPRYLALHMEGVEIRPSPGWMAARLLAGGLRPISNVVDVTNYVLLELGQPLHAFDAAKIHDDAIVVRRARRGETLRTLDGVDRNLHTDDVLIADRRRALALAGVMGGGDSEVSASTSSIILESAYFDPACISYTVRRHQLRTEASARFQRGADPEVVPYAAARAAALMSEIGAARAAAAPVDVYPVPIERARVTLRPGETRKLLGLEISTEEQARHLRSIGLEVLETDPAIDVQVPTFRPDLRREVDLVEEVARLAGFERLASTLPPGRAGRLTALQATERQIRRALAGFGLHEAWTKSFSSPEELDDLGLDEHHPARRMVMLANPLSEQQAALRTSVLPGLLGVAAHNFAQRAEGVAVFEIARVYEQAGQKLPQEALVLGAVLSGVRRERAWNAAESHWDLFSAKGIIEGLFSALTRKTPRVERVNGMPFHPTRAAAVYLDATPSGVLGEVHPDVCERFDVPEGTIVFELALAPLLAALPERISVEESPRFPAIYIDLALVVPEDVPASRIETTIVKAGTPQLARARLFDVYQGDQIAPGKKSLAYALELRAPDRTLTDDEAAEVRDRILNALAERTGAALRS